MHQEQRGGRPRELDAPDGHVEQLRRQRGGGGAAQRGELLGQRGAQGDEGVRHHDPW
jgi:hypothetical protein